STSLRYLEKSMTTAMLVVCPARLVPPPREVIGTLYLWHSATVSMASCRVLGIHTDGDLPVVGPIGGISCPRTIIEANFCGGLVGQLFSELMDFRGEFTGGGPVSYRGHPIEIYGQFGGGFGLGGCH